LCAQVGVKVGVKVGVNGEISPTHKPDPHFARMLDGLRNMEGEEEAEVSGG
jgi:hypothetical protein